jgi:hypothetical protein
MQEETVSKGVRFPSSMANEIEKLAEEETRNFSQQVIVLCKLGLEEHKKIQERYLAVAEGKVKYSAEGIEREEKAQ